MNKEQLVTFKGKKDGITIILDRAANFEELKEAFIKKIIESENFFGDSKISISFSGRVLSPNEKKELLSIMEPSMNVSEAAKTDDVESFTGITALMKEQDYSQDCNSTVYHKGALRSGQSIKHDGSIVVLGDVNPGAVLVAQGNIIVLGSVKGFVHAGAKGDDTCYIAALKLSPTQIRIADIITYIPPEMKVKNKQQIYPSYAYVEKGRIYIARI